MADEDLKATIAAKVLIAAGAAAARKAAEVAKPHVTRAKANWEWKQIPKKLAAEREKEALEKQREAQDRTAEAQNKVLAQVLKDDQQRRDQAKVRKSQAAAAAVATRQPPAPTPARAPTLSAPPTPAPKPAPAPVRKR